MKTKYFSFDDSPATLTGHIGKIFVPVGGATFTEILDAAGNDVTSDWVEIGATVAGVEIGGGGIVFSSVTGSAGTMNYEDLSEDRDFSVRA